MELHKAIKSIIETDGIEIIKDVRLVNILSDFQAFDTIPASKYILRAIIADGYTQKMLAIGSWNTQSENLCNQFVAVTGFQYDFTFMVFQSLAYGLGWINQLTQPKSSFAQNQQPVQGAPSPRPIKKLTTKEQREAHLLSKVEFLTNLQQETGLEMTNLSFEMYDEDESKCFNFNFEIKGRVKSKNDVDLYAVFYDVKNKIRAKENIWYYFHSNSNYRGIAIESYYIELPISVEEVGRICIILQ
ncbi:MAG: hypothetical protein IKU00_08830 [Bacteroidales bacterium]|nr:hypothetical protein [Bacteroidales bacterium]